jgi:hypothetical protein
MTLLKSLKIGLLVISFSLIAPSYAAMAMEAETSSAPATGASATGMGIVSFLRKPRVIAAGIALLVVGAVTALGFIGKHFIKKQQEEAQAGVLPEIKRQQELVKKELKELDAQLLKGVLSPKEYAEITTRQEWLERYLILLDYEEEVVQEQMEKTVTR